MQSTRYRGVSACLKVLTSFSCMYWPVGLTGRAPLLRSLCLNGITIAEQAMTDLCTATRKGDLGHLKELQIVGSLASLDDTVRLAEAIGVGCPVFEDLQLFSHMQARAMAAFLRAPQPLELSLDNLPIGRNHEWNQASHALSGSTDDSLSLREVAEALQQHAHRLPRLRTRTLWVNCSQGQDPDNLEPEGIVS